MGAHPEATRGSGDPQAGAQFTLTSITAVVIGGASVFGGRGTAIGALAGAILVGLMQNALYQFCLSATHRARFRATARARFGNEAMIGSDHRVLVLNHLQVSAYYQYIWTGALTLIAVIVFSFGSRRR
jgi:ribose/xylose/arabinose/galactoside ABC-type transport system permease subunit